LDQERSLLEDLFVQVLGNGQPLYSPDIVAQSQVLDKYITNYMKRGEQIGRKNLKTT
jgi:hypothetical protein